MKIRVVGKAHHSGTSKKTGKPFDFIEIHYLGKGRGIIGEAAQTAIIDPKVFRLDELVVPGDYIIEFDNHGFCVDFISVSGK